MRNINFGTVVSESWPKSVLPNTAFRIAESALAFGVIELIYQQMLSVSEAIALHLLQEV